MAQLALVSCPVDQAEALAVALVEARVAACVNILPRRQSVYRGQQQVQREDEALLLIKTRAECFDALRREVLARHPYELPEVIAVDIRAGHVPYLEWIAACTSISADPS